MKRIFCILFLITMFLSITDSYACTSVIITGRASLDGRPLMWKHRDTEHDNNRVEYFRGKKYSFIAVVNSESQGGEVWMGTNNTGFSIMNTASFNLKDDNIPDKDMNKEGQYMYFALSECKTVEEFENFIKNCKKPFGVEANFGVIDANGGAAYFEVNNNRYVKFDVNDPRIAPEGYLIYTNFSFTGKIDKGLGYIRYQSAVDILAKKAPFKNITPSWIFNDLSRSFYHSLLGTDLLKSRYSPEKNGGWAIESDYIPRRSSTSAMVIQGVKPGENPEMTIAWTILGYPPAGIVVPLFVKAGDNQPTAMLRDKEKQTSLACDYALEIRDKTYPIKRGSGSKYLYFNYIYNSKGTGYMQEINRDEKRIETLALPMIEKWRKSGIEINEMIEMNRDIDSIIRSCYGNLSIRKK